jgi:hypothetical protein
MNHKMAVTTSLCFLICSSSNHRLAAIASVLPLANLRTTFVKIDVVRTCQKWTKAFSSDLAPAGVQLIGRLCNFSLLATAWIFR